MKSIRVLVSESHNPWFNLATEEWIFREMDASKQTLFLWRNQETVVIGRNQNPWSECNLPNLERDGVHLARRTSGGGAVFQDLGNTNFTFLSPQAGYDRKANLEIILSALSRFGIHGEASGRNDLVINAEDGPRKFSGSAFRETRDRCFHHGTLLIDANLEKLGNYLTPNPKKLQSKGRASVRARVMNLREAVSSIDHGSLSNAIIDSFFQKYGGHCEIEELKVESLTGYPTLKEAFEKFSSWDWRFGHAPQFQQQMSEYLSWGMVEVHLDSDRGHVTRAKVFSDSLYPALIGELEAVLVGAPYTGAGIQSAMRTLSALQPGHAKEIQEFATWLETQVET